MNDCSHINYHEIEHLEESHQCKVGFRVIRMHQWECDDCGAILKSCVERDAVASGRAIDDYWGMTYEGVSDE